MKTTLEYLDAVKAKFGIESDYALAPRIGVTRAAISKYRNKKDHMGDETAIRVAALLELDTALVLAAVHVERARSDTERAAWLELFERLGGLAVSLVKPAKKKPKRGKSAGGDFEAHPLMQILHPFMPFPPGCGGDTPNLL